METPQPRRRRSHHLHFNLVPQTAGDISAGQHVQFQMPLPQTGADMSAGQHGQFQMPQQWAGNITQMLPLNMVPQPHIIYHAAPNGQGPLLLPPNPPGPIQYMPNIAFPQMAVANSAAHTPDSVIDPVLLALDGATQSIALPTPRPSMTPTPVCWAPPLPRRLEQDRRPQRRNLGQKLGQRLLQLSRSAEQRKKSKRSDNLALRKRVS